MSTQSIIVLAAIVFAFTLFGSCLAWADFYTQRGRKPGAGTPSTAQDNRRSAPDDAQRAA